MNELLDEMEILLSDLAQTGFSTGAPSGSRQAETLSEKLSMAGLPTASQIMSEISAMLYQRLHQDVKDDGPLMEMICAAVRYVELARQRQTQQRIISRWKKNIGTKGDDLS